MGDDFLGNSAYLWMTLAVLLGIAELLVPGVFLIWVAAAAAVTGIASLFIDMNFAGQLTLFGVSTIAAVVAGRRWYLSRELESSDPLLNDRRGRMIGQMVTIVQPITATSGRAKVGDSEWPARGPELQVGEMARIVDVASGVLIVEKPGALPNMEAAPAGD